MGSNGWYCKWDYGWWRDEKVRYLIKKGGEAAAFQYMKLVTVIYECSSPDEPGILDMNDEITQVNVQFEMGMDDSEFARMLDLMFDARLLVRDWYEGFGKLGSERTVRDATEIAARREKRIEAGRKGGLQTASRQASALASARATP